MRTAIVVVVFGVLLGFSVAGNLTHASSATTRTNCPGNAPGKYADSPNYPPIMANRTLIILKNSAPEILLFPANTEEYAPRILLPPEDKEPVQVTLDAPMTLVVHTTNGGQTVAAIPDSLHQGMTTLVNTLYQYNGRVVTAYVCWGIMGDSKVTKLDISTARNTDALVSFGLLPLSAVHTVTGRYQPEPWGNKYCNQIGYAISVEFGEAVRAWVQVGPQTQILTATGAPASFCNISVSDSNSYNVRVTAAAFIPYPIDKPFGPDEQATIADTIVLIRIR